MDVLLSGGMVYDGESLKIADVLLQNGRIAQTGPDLAAPGAEVFRADGCVIAPGFTDLHVHLRQPGYEQKETIATGTAAAAAGGFTTVCAMPNLSPVPDSLQNLNPQLKAIERDAVVRVLPYGAVTVGEKGACLADLEVLSGFVCGYSDDGIGVQDGEIMRRAMKRIAALGGLVAAHCEVDALLPGNRVCVQRGSKFANEHGWPGFSNESEWKEVERDIALAAETGCRLHICHASTAQSFELVRRAKARGLAVSCEAVPHNLLLCCDDITEDSGRFRMNPPLRTRQDMEAAQRALADGTIDAIATDHAPHTAAEKSGRFADSLNGVAGLETAFAACYTGLVKTGVIPLEKLLSLLTAGPRAVLREAPPGLFPGMPADLVVLDLNREQTVNPADFLSLGRSTPFAGACLQGWPVLTLCGGRTVYRR